MGKLGKGTAELLSVPARETSLLHRAVHPFRRRNSATGLPRPRSGEVVWLRRARSGQRARGRVAGSENVLSVVLESESPRAIRPRARIELEWLDAEGLTRARGRVGALQPGPPPLLEVALRGKPRLVERRAEMRAAVALEVSAWSLQHPTHRLSGRTINMSASGALLELPVTPEAAATLELQLQLPDSQISILGDVVRRGPGDLLAVRFAATSPADELERLARFVELLLQEKGPLASSGKG